MLVDISPEERARNTFDAMLELRHTIGREYSRLFESDLRAYRVREYALELGNHHNHLTRLLGFEY
jgi:hypothetical protein